MITNDDELKDAVSIVDEHIQEIQNYLGQNPHADGKIRFPRNFIRTAGHFRNQLSFVKDKNIKDNIAYALIQSDVYRWLTNRTDIFGTAKEMVMKSGIALMGSICETMVIDGTKGIIGKRHSFCERCNRMVRKDIISEYLKNELHWLWEARAAIHIYEINHREHEKYKMQDYNRAIKATRELQNAFEDYHSQEMAYNNRVNQDCQKLHSEAAQLLASGYAQGIPGGCAAWNRGADYVEHRDYMAYRWNMTYS